MQAPRRGRDHRQSPRRDHRNRGDRVHHRRSIPSCRASSRMAAGVASLGDDDIGTCGGGLLACGRVCTWQMILQPASLIRPVKGVGSPNDKSPLPASHPVRLERRRVLLQRPENEADADARVAGLGQLLANRIGWHSPSRPTEPPGIGDGGRKLPPAAEPMARAGSDARCRASG